MNISKVARKNSARHREEQTESPIIILDNALIHRSEFTKEEVNKMKFEFKFLPSCYPEAAPIKHVFCAIKSKLMSQILIKGINFDKATGANVLKETVDSIFAITQKMHGVRWLKNNLKE